MAKQNESPDVDLIPDFESVEEAVEAARAHAANMPVRADATAANAHEAFEALACAIKLLAARLPVSPMGGQEASDD